MQRSGSGVRRTDLCRVSTAPSDGSSHPLELKYLGAAGWEISDGNVVVLIDPYISRLKYGV